MSKNVLGNKKNGKLYIISAPAGAGKSTLVEMLLKEFPDEVAESCSVTTRKPRPMEVAGQHYAFVSLEEFEKRLEKGEFVEYVKVFGNYYGTPTQEITRLQKQGKHVVLVIDTQGAMQIKNKLEAVFIFISAPSLKDLRARLFRRQTEDEAAIEERLAWAKREMECVDQYDYHIVNDDLAITYQILKSIIIAEEHRN